MKKLGLQKIFKLLERGKRVKLDYNQWEEIRGQLCQVSGAVWSEWEWLFEYCLSKGIDIDPIYYDDFRVYSIHMCDVGIAEIYDYYTNGNIIFEIDWCLREWDLIKKLSLTYLFTSSKWEEDKIVELYYAPSVM